MRSALSRSRHGLNVAAGARVFPHRRGGAGVSARGLAPRALAASGRSSPVAGSWRPSAQAAASTVSARGAASASEPARSALAVAAQKLRAEFNSPEAIAAVASDADAPADMAAVVRRLEAELAASEGELEVVVLGEALAEDASRRTVTATTPGGPAGRPSVRSVRMRLPNVEDICKLISTRKEQKPSVEKPQEMADILGEFLKEKYYGKRNDHIALVSAWNAKPLGDAEGEFAEVGALMDLSLRAFGAALKSSKEDFHFEVSREGDGRDCLVMPPANFALLGLKDTFHTLLQGYRVLLVVQPRFFPHFQEMQRDFADCGLPAGLLEVVPGITPEADPEVLHEVLRHVDRLQFTGSSAMFKSLVKKAYELGNLRLDHGGEVSGLNKVRLDGVPMSHPAATAGTAWAAMANNGELCTSASLVEFDPSTGDSAEGVKTALEGHSFKLGKDPSDAGLNVLLKDGKTEVLEVKTQAPELREWWEKTILAVPQGSSPNTSTNQSLGFCVYAPNVERAVQTGVKEHASCIYMVGVPEDASAPSARAGTTGCKVPESVFGGMKSHTFAVAGDHDGVGSPQTLLNTVKRRGANWRDRDEAYSKYELTETAEDLLEFLAPREQDSFQRTMANVLDIFAAFEPQVGKPYNGQPLVGGSGRSQLVTLPALKPARKSLFIPRGIGLPENVVKVALLQEMSPLKEIPVDLHLLGLGQKGKLRVTDPLKSFLRIAEKRLGWKLHMHDDMPDLVQSVASAEYPPYFLCIQDRHLLPVDFLMAVADRGGYLYEDLPDDPLTLFRWMTATQAWTVSCTESQVAEAQAALQQAWSSTGLREERHAAPEVVTPPRSRMDDIGGGFGAGGMGLDDGKDWKDLDDSDDDDSSEEEDVAEKKDGAPAAAPAGAAAAGSK